MYEVFFDLNINLCDRFTGLDPFTVRKQRFHDVMLIFRRLAERNKTKKKTVGYTKNGVTYRPSSGSNRFPISIVSLSDLVLRILYMTLLSA